MKMSCENCKWGRVVPAECCTECDYNPSPDREDLQLNIVDCLSVSCDGFCSKFEEKEGELKEEYAPTPPNCLLISKDGQTVFQFPFDIECPNNLFLFRNSRRMNPNEYTIMYTIDGDILKLTAPHIPLTTKDCLHFQYFINGEEV